jgi:hypothetical protein
VVGAPGVLQTAAAGIIEPSVQAKVRSVFSGGQG